MVGQRAKGSGSVYSVTQKGRTFYRGQVDTGTFTPGGSRRYITVSASTEAEAKRRLRARQNEIAKNGVPTASTMSVKAWSELWLPMYADEVRPKTYDAAASAIKVHIIPTIGKKRLDRLTPADVRAVQNACPGQASALRTRSVLDVMLKAAAVEGHQVPTNVHLTKRPAIPESSRDAIPLKDALALLKVASARADSARWVAALLQGMRQGECLGLTWKCVDLAGGTLDVSWQLQRLPYADRAADTFRVPKGYTCKRLHGAFHLVRPKSEKGRRVIPLVPWMSTALESWRDAAPPNVYGLVWGEGQRARRAVYDREQWYALQGAAKVRHVGDDGERRRYTLHEARHTTATLLLEAGVDPETIKAILGHSSIVTSRGYQHVSQALARKALESVAERLRLDAPT